MSKLYKKNDNEKLISNICNAVWIIVGIVILIIGVKIYNPEKHFILNSADKAYKALQNELSILYKKNGYSFKQNKTEVDEFCTYISTQINGISGDCANYKGSFGYKENFTIKKSKIQIWGLEKAPYKMDGTLVKDFFIDINGNKGENRIGIDRFPIRIYAKGRMGGLLVPINCNKLDEQDYGFITSPVCNNESEIDFLNTTIPFGYDVIQIGGKQGNTVTLNSNVSFLRADCTAFGGEMIADEFCTEKGYPWIPACYDEYPCATRITNKKS